MEAFKKQATRLREQVAKQQQVIPTSLLSTVSFFFFFLLIIRNFCFLFIYFVWQAVLKHLGHLSNEGIIVDEAELQCYRHLQNLYNSTRTAKV
jgi:endophilin-A